MDEVAASVFFLHACSLRTRVELLQQEAEAKSARLLTFIGLWESLDTDSEVRSLAQCSVFTELNHLKELQQRIRETERVETILLALFFQLPSELQSSAQS